MLIETERLTLRPLQLGDLDELLALYEDPELVRFLGPLGRVEAESRLRDNEREWRERGYARTAIIERASGSFLGRSGLKYWPQFDETEVGWAIRTDARGRGYATEAGRASIEWGLAALDVPYITAMIEAENAASLAVARHLGMEPLREDVLLGRRVTVFAIERATAG